MKTPLKIVLSIWVVFHIIVIVTLANDSSYPSRHEGGWLSDYANLLGVNATWNFFSPDPAHTMYVKYTVRFEDESGQALKEPQEGYLPDEKDQIVVDSSRRRLLYAVRSLLLDPSRVETLLGPWLCRHFPGASEVAIDQVLEALPSLDQSVSHLETPVQDLKERKNVGRNVFDCLKLAANTAGSP